MCVVISFPLPPPTVHRLALRDNNEEGQFTDEFPIRGDDPQKIPPCRTGQTFIAIPLPSHIAPENPADWRESILSPSIQIVYLRSRSLP